MILCFCFLLFNKSCTSDFEKRNDRISKKSTDSITTIDTVYWRDPSDVQADPKDTSKSIR
jgi:hypothetical protein